MHFLGLLRYQQGEARSGIDLVRQALELDPAYADAHNNLGNMLRDHGHVDEALTCYLNALEIRPDLVEAMSNVGVIERYRGNYKESFHRLAKAVELAPDAAFAHFNLGSTLAAVKEVDGALRHFRRAVELDPGLSVSYLILGRLLSNAGRSTEAAAMYQELLELDPGNVIAAHMLAAVTGRNVPDKASKAFVVETFDQFASSFEAQLGRLEYEGPRLVAEALRARHGEPDASLEVLDLGCGTGLCGRAVRPFARTLTGIDLSPQMLRLARGSGCYDHLYRAELLAHLADTRHRYDVIVSADTLCYFGPLDAVFRAAREHLKPRGCLVFTVEQLDSDDGRPFVLESHGRYAHAIGYLNAVLDDSGFLVEDARCEVLRKELGENVDGWVVSARAKA